MDFPLKAAWVVTTSFRISGRGIAAVVKSVDEHATIKRGDTVLLVTPGGDRITSKISGLEFALHAEAPDGVRRTWEEPAVIFEKGTVTDAVPEGTRIYLVAHGESAAG